MMVKKRRRFCGDEPPQRLRFEHPHSASPAEEPCQDIAFLPHGECDEQSVWRLFFRDGEV